MKIYVEEFTLSTRKRFELIDITSRVEEIVKKSNVNNGILLVYAPHATVSIIVNENESGLVEDIIDKVREFTEPDSSKWRHNVIDDNAHAHIGSALFNSSRVFPVINSRVARGTWQNIFLLEMDGPRASRKIYVVVMGEEK